MNEYEAQYQMNSALQNEQSQQNLSVSAPQMQEYVQQAQAILVSQTNPQKVIRQIELQLAGYEERPDGTTVRVNEPIMNDLGISRIKFILRGFINQNTILSHLDQNEINKIIIGLGRDVTADIAKNWRLYEVKSRDYVVTSVLSATYFSLKRALGMNEKNWLGKITVETLGGGAQRPSFKKDSFLSKFKL